MRYYKPSVQSHPGGSGNGASWQPAIDSGLVHSDGRKPSVLALWSSLITARELYDFCNSDCVSIGSFHFDVLPLSGLGEAKILQSLKPVYFEVLIAYSSQDAVDEVAINWLREWARGESLKGKTPLMVCKELNRAGSGGEGRAERTWHEAIQELAGEFDGEVVWDIRPFAYRENADPPGVCEPMEEEHLDSVSP